MLYVALQLFVTIFMLHVTLQLFLPMFFMFYVALQLFIQCSSYLPICDFINAYVMSETFFPIRSEKLYNLELEKHCIIYYFNYKGK